jgi:hypothetical protein
MTTAEKRSSLLECIQDARDAAEDYRRTGNPVLAAAAEVVQADAERQLAKLNRTEG